MAPPRGYILRPILPGEIVTGRLDDWLPHGHDSPVLLERDAAGVAEHGHHVARPFRNLHQVDTISRTATSEFLERNVTCWHAKQHPRGLFASDLMVHPTGHCDGRELKWSHYLNSTPWGRDIVLLVRAFHIVWLSDKNRPGFWISLRDGSSGTLDVLESGNCSIKWNNDADEVAWN